eukprot:1095898_1
MYLFVLLLIFISAEGSPRAIFSVPFEISFGNSNPFSFTVDHLTNFIEFTSSFFEMNADNITIAFIKDVSATHYIDIGFTVSADSFNDERRIRETDIDLYRSYLVTITNLPPIIGIESKYGACSNGKYSTFYHYKIECQWLCDHLSTYINKTNDCQSIANVSSTVYVKETNLKRFVYLGYGCALLLTLCFCILYLFTISIQNKINSKASKSSAKKAIKTVIHKEGIHIFIR